ncbi:major facilitator superfamily domain-containing protein [Scheffersomyces xylosifermentans]|uniref:major facilitator superfamily domain-containing protein n=1 Tax=Scheffersomyces xylosifermentans TaxID=1304137 RepID=UPI00315D63D3
MIVSDSGSINEKAEFGPTVLQDDPDRFPEGGFVAYRVLVGSFLGLTGVLAFVNSAGAVENFIQANILQETPTSTIGWIFSIYNFFGFGMTLISGPVFDKVGCKIPIAFGILLMTVGFICASFATEVYQFILAYSVCAGLGTAFTFGPFVGVLTHYFLKKRAMAIGGAYVGGALGGVLFPVMFRSLFPKIGFGWSVRIGAFICLALLVLGFLLVSDRHKEFNQIDPNSTESVVAEIVRSIDFSIFKNKVYTCLVLALLGNGFAFLVTATYLPSYATTFGYSDSNAYLLLVVFNSLSIPGRIIPSYIADHYGRFNAICIISSISTLAFFLVWVNRPAGHTLAGLFVFSAVFGFSSGSILSLTPASIGQVFKVEDIGKGIGTAFFVLSFGDLVGIPIGGAITNSRTRDSYDHLVLFVAFCSLFGTVGSFTARYLYAGVKMVKV